MSTFIDLLAIPQEEAIMQNLSQRMAIPYAQIDPKYFTFTYNQLDNVRVAVQIFARAQALDGTKSPWTGERTVQFHRAQFRGIAAVRVLQVNYVDGMAIEHILRALKLLHSFHVTVSELEFLNQATGQWVKLADAHRPQVSTLQCRFAPAQGRFAPAGSEFSIALVPTIRSDIGEYLRIIAAGTVAGAL